MPTMWERDLDRDRAQFYDWLDHKLDHPEKLVVGELVSPASSGFSNDTLLCDVSWDDGGQGESCVVRIQPQGFTVFPDYDLSLQYLCMQKLADSPVPVPTVLWTENNDQSVFGAPFYVMRHVKGRVPGDNPPYHNEGWLHELSPKERNRVWLGGFECMAGVHALDWKNMGFDFLAGTDSTDVLQAQLDNYDDFFDWASRGREQPVVEVAREWLRKNAPAVDHPVVSWGDARIGNVIFDDDCRPAAVLDWEMACIGTAEQDVAWGIFLDRHHSEGISTPRLEGFCSYEESLEYYQRCADRELGDLHYWEVFAGFRFSVIMMRISQQLVRYELMDEATGYAFELDNTCTNLLAGLLDLAPPGEGRTGFSQEN